MDDMLGSGSDNEGLFDAPAQTAAPEATGGLDGMLAAGSDDEDLFGQAAAPAASSAAAAAAPVDTPASSALIEWERAKQAELAELDKKNEDADAKLREAARDKLDQFNKTIREAQEKREQHNKEIDQQTVAAQKSGSENKWETVVGYIDFNRSDLHERDVSRMKTLLLQLKH